MVTAATGTVTLPLTMSWQIARAVSQASTVAPVATGNSDGSKFVYTYPSISQGNTSFTWVVCGR